MISILLSICFLVYAVEIYSANEKKRPRRNWIVTPAIVVGGFLSIAVLLQSGMGMLQENTGKPGSAHFRTGKLVPNPLPTSESAYRFSLQYEERTWWGKGKPKSWRVRWNEVEGEYEFLDGRFWRPLPINFSRQDDREFATDNRGTYEIR